MDRLRNLSLRWKLFGSFGITIALLLCLLGAAFWMSSQLATATGHITNGANPKVNAANAVKYDSADMDDWETSYVLDMGKSHNGFLQSKSQILHDIATLHHVSVDSHDKASAAAVQAAYQSYASADAQVWTAVQAGDQAKAAKIAQTQAAAAFAQLAKASDGYVAQAKQEQVDDTASFDSAKSTAQLIMIVIGLIALGFAGGIAFLLTRYLVGTSNELVDRLQSLANHCAADLRTAIEAVAKGDLTKTVTPVTPLIENPSNDELGSAAKSVNTIRNSIVATVEAYGEMRSSMSGMIREMTDAAAAVAGASQQMAGASEETGRAVSEIAQAVSDVAQGAERQVRMVTQSRDSAEQASQSASQASEIAAEGVGTAEQASEAMQTLSASTEEVTSAITSLSAKGEQIGGIVETITTIAGQTNLLALNAAIEAARAGEQGRGFAVVAEEVRKLAEESQQAAGTIAELIGEIQAETERAVTVVMQGAEHTSQSHVAVERAKQAFMTLGGSVEQITVQVSEIATAATEVAAVAEQSSASTEQVSASTEETSASAEEISAQAQELAATAQTIERMTQRFTLAAEV
jgi:methyl-accepting chemotaxis protein